MTNGRDYFSVKTIELTSEEIEQLKNGEDVTLTFDHPMKYEEILIKKKPKQWDPKGGIYHIHGNGIVSKDEHIQPAYDLFGTSRDNYEQAKKATREMRTFNRLLAYRDEFDPDFEFTEGCGNCCIGYDYKYKPHVSWGRYPKILGAVYMSEKVSEELCRKLNSGEVVL